MNEWQEALRDTLKCIWEFVSEFQNKYWTLEKEWERKKKLTVITWHPWKHFPRFSLEYQWLPLGHVNQNAVPWVNWINRVTLDWDLNRKRKAPGQELQAKRTTIATTWSRYESCMLKGWKEKEVGWTLGILVLFVTFILWTKYHDQGNLQRTPINLA